MRTAPTECSAGPLSLARFLARTVGALDALSGAGLVFGPAFTLRVMLIPAPGEEALGFVRFVGAFVVATGFAYLWGAGGGTERLRTLCALFLLPRLSVGLFTAWAVLAAGWPPAWGVVAAVDLGLAATQAWFVRTTRKIGE